MSDNKISTENFKNAVLADYSNTTDAAWHGLNLKIKKCLPLGDMLRFVHDVVSSCFSSEDGGFTPEIKEFAIRCAVLEYYADIELPNDPLDKYDLVYPGDAVGFIMSYIDKNQFYDILNAINDKIEHTASANIEAVTVQMNKVTSNLETLEQKFSSVFSGIDDDVISKIADALAGGMFSEEKLVKAFTHQNDSKNENVIQMPSV